MFVRSVGSLFFILLLTGCAAVLPMANYVSKFCPSTTDTSHQYFGPQDADDLVIFIHGLCGDAKATWTNTTTHFVFPEELARDFAKENQPAYVMSFDYVSRLQGGPSILTIADHLEFEISELLKKHPYRTLRIVAHSMGGLVAREYILRRQPLAHPQLKITNVVLLAAPNNGSELAELGQLISEHRQVEELRHIDKGNTYLESLNRDWNREFKGGWHPRHVLLYAGFEGLPIRLVGQVVKLSSAIAYADDLMEFQEDHISIAKPKDRREALYRWVKARLEDSLQETLQKLKDGIIVQQGLLAEAGVSKRLRTVELLERFQSLAGTELEKVLTHVKAGQFQAAQALLKESEWKEKEVMENVAQHRFLQGEIYELQFMMAQAASYYSQAVQLVPIKAQYRQRYGWSLILMGNAQDAILQLDAAVRLSRTSSDRFLEGIALGELGVAYDHLGQYAKAIEHHEQALVIHRQIGNVHGEGNTLGNLGNPYQNLGQYAKAIDYYEQALAIHRQIGDVEMEGTDLGNLGTAYQNLKQYAKAIHYHEQALAIHRRIGDVRGQGHDLGNLGVAYDNLGQYAKAIEYHEQALTINRKIGHAQGEGIVLGNLGSTHRDLKQYAKAIDHYEQALAIHRQIGNVQGEAIVLGNLGLAYDDLGQYAKAIELLKASEAIFQKRLGVTSPFKAVLARLTNETQN